MTDGTRQKRLLWNDPSVVVLCGIALLATIAIIGLQTSRRRGVYDPETVGIFDRLFLFQDYPTSWLLMAMLLVAMVPAVQQAGSRLARWFGENPGIVATLSIVLLAAGARFAYMAHPLAMDETAAYMQSEAFAAGALLGRLPAPLMDWLVVPGFQAHFFQVSHQTGEVASAYWPGFALLLTPFVAAGVPWLCNPVLGGLSVWAVQRMARKLTGSVEVAGTAALFMLASAAFVVNAISFYSMTAHLLSNAVFVLLLLNPSPRRALAAGAIGGLSLTLHNPVPHLLFAVPWLLWLLFQKDRVRLCTAVAIGYLPWVVIVGFAWHLFTLSLVPVAADGTVTAEIGPIAELNRQLAAIFRLPDGELLDARLVGLAKLWLWATPAMVLVAVAGYWRFRRDWRFQLLFASAALTFIGFLFVPVSQGHGWGFRYFHSAWFVLPLFAAATVATPSGSGNSAQRSRSNILGRYAQGAALGGLLVLTPFFVWQVHGFIAGHLAQLPATDHGRPRVVIINPYTGYYAQDLVQNDPFLRDPVIRMITHGRQEDEAMMSEYFPDLVLLSHSYRGSVWGYADDAAATPSSNFAVGRDE